MVLFNKEVNLTAENIMADKSGVIDESVVYELNHEKFRSFFESKYTAENVVAIHIVEDLEDNIFYWVVQYDSRNPLCENPICFMDGYGTAFVLSDEEKKLLHNLVVINESQLVMA